MDLPGLVAHPGVAKITKEVVGCQLTGMYGPHGWISFPGRSVGWSPRRKHVIGDVEGEWCSDCWPNFWMFFVKMVIVDLNCCKAKWLC